MTLLACLSRPFIDCNDTLEVLGFILAVFIGITLGLIGGGGSILTVPVLVYLFHFHPTLATSYSLLIVGFTSMVGAVYQYSRGQVDLRIAATFGMTSLVIVFLTRKFVLPAIPDVLLHVGNFTVHKSATIMVLFAALMLASSVSMIRGGAAAATPGSSKFNTKYLALTGIGVGLVTGLLGAGGGFLIIPALVILTKTPIKKAVGTSLLIITINSLVGFMGDLGQQQIEWGFLGKFIGLTVFGVFVGSLLNKKIPNEKLKTGFGWFVLTMGIYILSRELF